MVDTRRRESGSYADGAETDFKVNGISLALIERLKLEHRHLLRRALAEACHWNRRIERNQMKPSDQFWIETFSTGNAETSVVKKFLTTYQINRATWDVGAVASTINRLATDVDFDPCGGVAALADKLAKTISSKNAGQRTSAASKVAMFTRPRSPVFMWDRLALVAIGARSAHRSGGAKLSGFRGRLGHDYESFHAASLLEFNEQKSFPDFASAVREFIEFVDFTRDGRRLAERGYFERRLFDKLLVCEGERIEELRRAER